MRRTRSVVQTLRSPEDPVDERVDAVELRLDLYPDVDIAAFAARCDKTVIATARRASDGGRFEGSEAERLDLLRPARWVDLEVDVEPDWTPEHRIVSFHDCGGMPDDLDAVFSDCMLAGGDAVKIAATPSSAAEAFRLLELPTPGIGMGPYGEFTRVLAPLTYCAREPLAPGMPTPETLFDTFRIRRLGPAPALYGVAGDPIAHSRSPDIHNAGFDRDGIDAAYLRFKVDDLEAFWPVFVAHGGRALSITAPLKLQAARLATRPSDEVLECGSANTLLADGRAFNTDYLAFLEMVPPGSGDALVMGAGGAGRAAIAALRRLGYRPRAWDQRTGEVDVEYVASPYAAPVVINTTPVDPPAAPFVLDLRYGAGRDDGLEFLRAQARHQYKIFTGNEL